MNDLMVEEYANGSGKKLSQTLDWSDLDRITEGKALGLARSRQKTEMKFWRAWRLMRSPVRARFLRLLGSSHYADVLANVLAEQQRAYYAAEGFRMFPAARRTAECASLWHAKMKAGKQCVKSLAAVRAAPVCPPALDGARVS